MPKNVNASALGSQPSRRNKLRGWLQSLSFLGIADAEEIHTWTVIWGRISHRSLGLLVYRHVVRCAAYVSNVTTRSGFEYPKLTTIAQPDSDASVPTKEFHFFKDSGSRMQIPDGGEILSMSPKDTKPHRGCLNVSPKKSLQPMAYPSPVDCERIINAIGREFDGRRFDVS